jgi:hypothetical protein
MTRKPSRLLVIDACVAQSAGETEHPVSSACRKFLIAVKEICHRAVLSEPLADEWKRHQSRFTRKWRVSMAARKKPVQIVTTAEVQVDFAGLPDSVQRAVGKDRHLLEAAMAGDRIIVTLDEKLRNALRQLPKRIRWVKTIRWINPVVDGVAALEKL